MDTKYKNAQIKALQYWFIDGLVELAAGLIGILLAILFWVWKLIFVWRWSLPVIFIIALSVSFGLRLIIQRIKARMTYPQTGYVSPFSGFETKRSIVILIIIILLIFGVNYILSKNGEQGALWSPGLSGMVFFAIFIWLGISTHIKRFYLLALISFSIGLIMALKAIDYFHGLSILSGVIGLVLLLQGYRVRKTYLHQNSLTGISHDE